MAQFEKGQSGNPTGRPNGARNKLSEGFVLALADDFAAHGAAAIVKVREEKPDQYLKVIASLVPRDFNLKVNDPFAELSDEDLARAIAAVDASIKETRARELDEDASVG